MLAGSHEISFDVAVIGAGVSGTYCAAQLREWGYRVVVIEKARGSGGRLSSKRLSVRDEQSVTIDLGASDFSMASASMRARLTDFVGADLVTNPASTKTERFVANPRNSVLTRKLLEGTQSMFSTRVTSMHKASGRWIITAEERAGEPVTVSADRVIVSAPPAQASDLLPEGHAMKQPLAGISMIPQWVVALVVDQLSSDQLIGIQSAADASTIIDRVSLESDKPGRESMGMSPFVFYLDTDWSADRIDWDKERVLDAVVTEAIGGDIRPEQIITQHVHRWLYSMPPKSGFSASNVVDTIQSESSKDSYWGEDKLGICGDYMSHAEREGVERAYLSARSLLEKFKRTERLSEARGVIGE